MNKEIRVGKVRMLIRVRRNKFFWWRKAVANKLNMKYHEFVLVYWYKVPKEALKKWKETFDDPEVKKNLKEIAKEIMERHRTLCDECSSALRKKGMTVVGQSGKCIHLEAKELEVRQKGE